MSQPAHKIRDGVLSVVIWRNKSNEGNTYYTIDSPTRSYKKGDETWKETTSLNSDDALAASQLLVEAYTWVKNQKRADSAERKQANRVTAQ